MIPLVRVVSAALLIVPALSAAQKPLVLIKPEAEYPEPFSQLSGIRELRDGRVLVADAREKLLQILDFRGGATKVGREGTGPGEYITPMRVVALQADTSAVWDGGNVRYLLVHPDGTPGKDFRIESARQGLGLSVRPLPRGVDARGNIYFEGPAFHLDHAGRLTPSDSVPVLRFDRTSMRVDTVTFAGRAKGSGSVSPGPGGEGVTVLSGRAHPLEPRDDWVVLPDGRVAVVRGDDYHIDYFTSRVSKSSGPAIAYDKIKVDGAVKRMIEEERDRVRRNAIGTNSGRGGAPARSDLPAPPPLAPLTTWPDVMPPFLAQAAIARPNGQVWVRRTQRPGTGGLLYDIFDVAGRLVGHVVLPPRTQLIGFGQGTVYLVRLDDDDLQYLQRYRLAMDAKLSG